MKRANPLVIYTLFSQTTFLLAICCSYLIRKFSNRVATMAIEFYSIEKQIFHNKNLFTFMFKKFVIVIENFLLLRFIPLRDIILELILKN